jgi:signal recognition particle GTPase
MGLVRRSSSMNSTQLSRMMDSQLDHPRALAQAKNPIYRVCLTGGPCAGKTTALATLAQSLTDKGYNVLQVPEAATILMKGGAMI